MKNKTTLLILTILVFGGIFYFMSQKPSPDALTPIEGAVTKAVTEKQIMDDNPKASKRYKIGVLFPMLAAPFWVNESYGVLDQAQKLGVDVIWYSADAYTNVDKQNAQIEDLITQNVDAILIAPTSLTGNSPAIEKAISKGIKVLVHVTGTSAAGVICSVTAADEQIGRTQAEYTIRMLKGRGKVIMLTGPSGADWAANRVRGYKEHLTANAPDIIIVAERSGEPEKTASQKIIEELLIKFTDVDAIYTAADGMAIGVAEVLARATTVKQIVLTTASFSKESVPFIRNGQISLNVDESPVLQGRTAMNAVIYALEGYSLPKTILVPVPGIDKDAVEKVDMDLRWAPIGYSPK